MKNNYGILIGIIFLFILGSDKKTNAQSFQNPSVELWANPNACDINLPPDSWSEYSNGGIGCEEANFNFCTSTIPPAPSNGMVYARAYGASQTTGEGFYQVLLGFSVNSNYRIDYDYAGSNLYGGTGPVVWHLFIDDIDVDQTVIFQSTDAIWTSHGYIFTATATSHKIGFRLYSATSSAGSGAIDHIDISLSTGSAGMNPVKGFVIFPDPVKDKLTIGNCTETSAISILNCLGQPIETDATIAGDQIIVNVERLQKGIYFLRIFDEYKVIVKKFVKE